MRNLKIPRENAPGKKKGTTETGNVRRCLPEVGETAAKKWVAKQDERQKDGREEL